MLFEMQNKGILEIHNDAMPSELERYFGNTCEYNHVTLNNVRDNEFKAFCGDLKTDVPRWLLSNLKKYSPGIYNNLKNIYRRMKK